VCEHSPNHASQLDSSGKWTDKRFDEERAGENSSLPARLGIQSKQAQHENPRAICVQKFLDAFQSARGRS